MLNAEMLHRSTYDNEYIQGRMNWMLEGYSGRVTNYDNGIIEINPPLTAEQYGSSYVVTHRQTKLFITYEKGQPH